VRGGCRSQNGGHQVTDADSCRRLLRCQHRGPSSAAAVPLLHALGCSVVSTEAPRRLRLCRCSMHSVAPYCTSVHSVAQPLLTGHTKSTSKPSAAITTLSLRCQARGPSCLWTTTVRLSFVVISDDGTECPTPGRIRWSGAISLTPPWSMGNGDSICRTAAGASFVLPPTSTTAYLSRSSGYQRLRDCQTLLVLLHNSEVLLHKDSSKLIPYLGITYQFAIGTSAATKWVKLSVSAAQKRY
jgi:hypothetical protein